MDHNEFHTVRGYELLEQNHKLLTSAMEDYLEMIYRHSMQDGYMRLNKLAELLNVRASSASKMVQKLGESGLLKYEKYGLIILTATGREIGAFLLQRHRIVEEFLRFLGCDEDLLVQTELIEHHITSSTLNSIDILNQFFIKHQDIAEQFRKYKNLAANK
jgi:Mn-dependent DtxR family transcriptional regulator